MKVQTLLSVTTLAAAACAGCVQPPIGEQAQPIINGTVDNGDPAVVLSFAYDAASSHGALCTATQISPHVLLTAAHCLDPAVAAMNGVTPTYSYFVSSSKSLDFADNSLSESDFDLAVKAVAWDPQFSADITTLATNGHDIGIIALANARSTRPVPVNHTALEGLKSFVGSDLHVVGYGVTDGGDSTGASAGTKREASISVDSIDSNFIVFQNAKSETCEGDSGGPAMMEMDGEEVIVGTTDFGQQGCPLTTPTADARVDVYAGEIDDWVHQYDPDYDTTPKKHHGCSFGDDRDASATALWALLLPMGLLVARRRRNAPAR